LETRPIRVSFMIDDLGRAGTETQLLALLRTLDRDAIEPDLVLLNGEGELSRSLEPLDLSILRLGVAKLFGPSGGRAAKRLRDHWLAVRPDVAQIYFLDSAYLGVPVARWAGVPKVVRVRNNLGHWLTRKHRLLNRVIRPLVDVTLTNSEEGREALMKHDGLAPERIAVIENGVDLERFPDHPLPPRGETIRIGTVANLRPVKNIDGLMRAAKRLLERHPNVRIEVAGEGEQRPELERLHTELQLGSRFVLRGSLRDVPGFLASLDIAVLPSHSEGMSNALLEFMAAGRPVVATDVGANAKLLDRGGCGLLVPPRDEDSLVAALSRLIENERIGSEMGRAGRKRVERDFSRGAMRAKFEDFYRQLAGAGRNLE
jgi:glycosyltransferase involved in cell wall biosynthesis